MVEHETTRTQDDCLVRLDVGVLAARCGYDAEDLLSLWVLDKLGCRRLVHYLDVPLGYFVFEEQPVQAVDFEVLLVVGHVPGSVGGPKSGELRIERGGPRIVKRLGAQALEPGPALRVAVDVRRHQIVWHGISLAVRHHLEVVTGAREVGGDSHALPADPAVPSGVGLVRLPQDDYAGARVVSSYGRRLASETESNDDHVSRLIPHRWEPWLVCDCLSSRLGCCLSDCLGQAERASDCAGAAFTTLTHLGPVLPFLT